MLMKLPPGFLLFFKTILKGKLILYSPQILNLISENQETKFGKIFFILDFVLLDLE